MLTSQINPGKFKLATELGMTQGVNPKDHADKSIQSVLIEMSPTGWGTCTYTAFVQKLECIAGWS